MRGLKLMAWSLGLALVLGLSSAALAQQGGGGGGGAGGGGRGGWGGMNMQQMQEMRLNRIKDDLKVTDEEWTALKPAVQKVQDMQMAAMAGRFGGGRGRGGPQANTPTSPVAQKAVELRETLDNAASTADQIKVKLEALRAARKQAEDELAKAQASLKDLLTVRQEAVLVEQGMLQ